MLKFWNRGSAVDSSRRRWIVRLGMLAGAVFASSAARAEPQAANNNDFPGDAPEHRVVYQLNKPDADYHDHIVFSVGAMLRQYGDNIRIAVVAFGPGIHVLLNKPRRPVTPTVREKLASLADYGVEFYACGNTLKSLKLAEQDVVPYAQVVEVGASKLMELQKQGYAYISW